MTEDRPDARLWRAMGLPFGAPGDGMSLGETVARIIGPFCRWLVGEVGGGAVAVMREGRLIADLTRLLGGPPMAETWLNRRLTMRAAIADADDGEALLNFLVRARRQPLDGAAAARELGLDHVPPPSWCADVLDNATAQGRFFAWLGEGDSARQVITVGRDLRRRLLAHLAACGADVTRPMTLVDLGYAGNIQHALARILAIEDGGPAPRGLYLLTTAGIRWARRAGCVAQGFVADGGDPAPLVRLFARSPEPLELCCTTPGLGTVADYDKDGAPRLLAPPWGGDQAAAMTTLQAEVISKVGEAGGDVVSARLSLARLLALPNRTEAAAVASWVYDENMPEGLRLLCGGGNAAIDPWAADRAQVPWPAAAARLAGADDHTLVAGALRLIDGGSELLSN